MLFKNRADAGKQMAKALMAYHGNKDVIILALPRGGLPVGCEIARLLEAPLSIIVSKKIPFPGNDELAIGAVSLKGTLMVDHDAVKEFSIPRNYIENEKKRLKKEVAKTFKLYTGSMRPPSLAGKIAILTDDGIATGSTLIAALTYVRLQKPARIIVAIPVAPSSAKPMLEEVADDAVCLVYDPLFTAVGRYYKDFTQVSDDEAKDILNGN